MPEKQVEDSPIPFVPTPEQNDAINQVLRDYTKARSVMSKSYNYFNGRNLYDCIDDWTKRWNGYIPNQNPLLDTTQSQIFLNYTRNAVISYLVKIAMNLVKPKIIAVNKKNMVQSKQFAQFLKDANQFSLNAENGESKFFAAALETTVKGTCITYEGYLKQEQDMEVPDKYDSTTGKMKTKKVKKVIYDDCYQQIHPIEDFYIANPYQPNIQKQEFIIPRRICSYTEAKDEFGHYPLFKHVRGGAYTITSDVTTFYKNQLISELGKDQVEILPWFNRSKNKHVLLINGVPIYIGVIPFKDGKYPYAKAIFEPFANDFFWGAGFPNKIMGEQDLKNMLFNMMVDKTSGSLLPFGLSSDLDDLIEDDVLALNKIRKVGDINKWKFETLPGISPGEVQMLQLTDKELNDNSNGVSSSGQTSSPRGGKLAARQVMMQQQESMQKLGFSASFLEDYEKDRTDLRLAHILQFYSIPKLEAITGVNAAGQKKLLYRDITLHGTRLSNGKMGTKIIKLTDKLTPSSRKDMADQLSVLEATGEESGTPTEAIAVDINTFGDYNLEVQVIKNSSYEKNYVLQQSKRMEFANWRLGLAQIAPVNAPELVKYVEESFDDIDADRFEGQPGPQQAMAAQAVNGGQGGEAPQGQRPLSEMNRTDNTSALAKATQ